MESNKRKESKIYSFLRVLFLSLFIAGAVCLSYVGLDSYPVMAAESKQVMSKIRKAIKKMKLKDTDSTYDKVKKVHDWLIFNFEYDYLFWNYYKDDYADYTEEMLKEVKTHAPWRLEWAFEHSLANCSAYSKIFKLFMDELGVECRYISSKEMNHAWNMVLMDDGYWYHIDVTFDDTEYYDAGSELGGYMTKYFLRNDANFPEHYGWDEDTPKADGEYYEKNVNHNLYYIRTKKDKYWKNGNIKINYGGKPKCTDCVIKYYNTGYIKSEKYTSEDGAVVTKNYSKKGIIVKEKYVKPDGSSYLYKWNSKNEKQNRKGSFYSYGADGNLKFVYTGAFKGYVREGKGSCTNYYPNGNIEYTYEGDFVNYQWNGKGIEKYYYEDGSLAFVYEGDLVDYLREGIGIIKYYYKDGSIRSIEEGSFKGGKLDGKCTTTWFYETGGKYVCEGEFLEGKLVSGIKTRYDEYGNVIYVEEQ